MRVATLTGTEAAVSKAITDVGIGASDVLGPVDLGDDGVRTILRFDYGQGAEVAAHLRAELVNRLRRKHEGGEDVISGDDVQRLTDILTGKSAVVGESGE